MLALTWVGDKQHDGQTPTDSASSASVSTTWLRLVTRLYPARSLQPASGQRPLASGRLAHVGYTCVLHIAVQCDTALSTASGDLAETTPAP